MTDAPKVLEAYAKGIRTSIRYNSTAYGYSVLITATFGILSSLLGTPAVPEVFSFLAGAAIAFAIVEASVSNLFRHPVRGDRSEVVVLGSAMAIFSVSAGAGTSVLVGSLVQSGLGWFLGSFFASLVYIAVTGVEMTLAHRAEEKDD